MIRLRAWIARASASEAGESWLAIAIVVACVLFRSAPFVRWQLVFDSDEAIIGLMAKHIVEGRAFPMFFYGQGYMLAVEAWLAVPVFVIAGPSVAGLRLLLLGMNLGIALLLLHVLRRDAGLRPAHAMLPVLFFALTPPGTTARLMHANGGNAEPFLYVLLLWVTRSRPALAGGIFAVGLLNREFTLYGFVALLVVEAWRGALLTRDGLRRAGVMCRAAAGVWLLFQYLRDRSPGLGPGTSMSDVPRAQTTVFDIVHGLCFDLEASLAGMRAIVTDHWPTLLGMRARPVLDFGIDGSAWQGLAGAPGLLAVTMIAAVALVGYRIGAERRWRPEYDVCAYLVLTAVLSVAGYVLVRCSDIGIGVMRYDLLSLLGAAGLAAWCLAATPGGAAKRAWIMAAAGCIAVAGSGSARLAAEYAASPPPEPKRALARALEAQGVRYARADYWNAYSLSFLSGERVIITSDAPMRIGEYQRIVDAHPNEAFRIARRPCVPGSRLAEDLYLCWPPQ